MFLTGCSFLRAKLCLAGVVSVTAIIIAIADGLAVIAIITKAIVAAVGIIFKSYLKILFEETVKDSQNCTDGNNGAYRYK